jgi:kynureninase
VSAVATKSSKARFDALDAADPLAPVVARFATGEPGVLYFDANSIGAMPLAAQGALARLGDEWRRLRRRGWNDSDWLDAPQRLGRKLAPVIGAEPDSVLVCDSTSINLHKMLLSALSLRPDRKRVVVEDGAFPTDNYVAGNLVADLRRVAGPENVAAAIDEDVAVLFLTHTDYRTSYRHDLAALTKLAHQHGALTLWDLSHSAGAVETALAAGNADFAVGCGYKYLCGGPGSPAWLYIAPRHQAALRPAIAGWMGHADPMAMDKDYRPAPGVQRHLAGTPPVSGNLLMEAALDLWADIDPAQAFAKHAALGDRLIELVESAGNTGLTLASPRDAARRGGFVAFRHADAKKRAAALEAAGVIASYRKPDILRFGLSPLYHRFADIWELGQRLGRIQ